MPAATRTRSRVSHTARLLLLLLPASVSRFIPSVLARLPQGTAAAPAVPASWHCSCIRIRPVPRRAGVGCVIPRYTHNVYVSNIANINTGSGMSSPSLTRRSMPRTAAATALADTTPEKQVHILRPASCDRVLKSDSQPVCHGCRGTPCWVRVAHTVQYIR